MKFAKKTFTSDSCQKAVSLIETFLQRGGFEIQINIIDKETLLDAQKHPEQYADLVVRVGGYSDYYTRLSPQMQAEILLRTEHEI
jgi:formate C-acetyltransferase